jgi:prepilin-type N-terminal cleavage/methylation domain-containing protein
VRRMWKRLDPSRRHQDAGFTLIEVIVALVILGLVATGGLYFFVNGTRAVTHQQRSQNAVVVANQAMEVAHSVQPRKSATLGTYGVMTGRDQAAVQAAWSEAAAVGTEGLSDTYPSWDPGAAPVGGEYDAPSLVDDAVPLRSSTTLAGVRYDVTTLLGLCYRPLSTAAGASAACSTLAGQAVPPGSAPAGHAELVRAMVLVTWTATAGDCGDGGRCSYQLSSLIDPSEDIEWNNITQPIAVDDNAVVRVGESVVISVLDNDIIGPVQVNPVQKLTVTSGTGTITPVGKGQVRFTAPTDASGFMTFTYSLKDGQGIESNTATVRVTVNPEAVDDTATTMRGVPVDIPVTTNDRGTPASVTITTPPVAGTGTATVVDGTTVRFQPADSVGTPTFQYSFTDTSGLVSTVATVKVSVTNYAPPKVADLVVVIPATSPTKVNDLDMVNRTGNPPTYQYEIVSTSVTQGQLKVNGNNYNSSTNRAGTALAYQPQANQVGVFTFTYRTTTPDGAVKSEPRKVTMVVMPVPKADAFPVGNGPKIKAGGSATQLNIGANDVPTNFGGSTQFQYSSISQPSCGTLSTRASILANGIVEFTPPKNAQTCTFEYRVSGTGQYATLVSEPVTVTIVVTK